MLTQHFTWSEATVTHQRDPKTGLLLPNDPTPEARAALVRTFTAMEEVRSILGGRAINIHSAYRSPEVNRAVGGAPSSQHMRGEAVDFSVSGMGVREVFGVLRASGLPFDQLIEEAGTWVHVSFTAKPRGQALTMRVVGGRATYQAAA